MKKTFESRRSQKFILRNSLNYKNCEDYIRNLCDNVFGVKSYEISEYKDDEKSLCVEINDKKYYIYLDKDNVYLVCELNGQIIRKFTGDDCWSCSLCFLTEVINVVR